MLIKYKDKEWGDASSNQERSKIVGKERGMEQILSHREALWQPFDPRLVDSRIVKEYISIT